MKTVDLLNVLDSYEEIEIRDFHKAVLYLGKPADISEDELKKFGDKRVRSVYTLVFSNYNVILVIELKE